MSKETNQTTRPLQIGRPILQKATPSAESLISNAPGTGVSQTSILSKIKNSTSNKEKKSVVFCEPLTLPSPTNPNKPPIIHQQLNYLYEIHTDSNSSSPIPSESDSISFIESQDCKSELITHDVNIFNENLRAPIASPESCKIRDSFADKIKSKIHKNNDKSVEKSSSLRNIDISNPVLKSEIDLKVNLIPINSSFLTNEVSISKRSTYSRNDVLSRTADDFNSPRKTNSSKERPISIAIFRPVRPRSPPPPCPSNNSTKGILSESKKKTLSTWMVINVIYLKKYY
ncbi:unnamed protein product [Lepeophtheirus salmonis]|uniref:(salmon louse) hypothetical protein n=1 Tax=Lepeophtheirus salmonis TaxID=72036 RepID=A0A7R8CNX4_LEPSM|nr:unnamed protein product [Lepeophtheirus salmonis]CAF2876064.1 unnamed protein product [Lepeophtheirus salmonis]